MSDRPLRLAVLISGSGSNLKALIEANERGELNLDIAHVISNRAGAGGLDHARGAGISTSVIDAHTAPGGDQDQALADLLAETDANVILLSGYMRILGAELVSTFQGRMINQHPSLLPLYKGLHTYQRVLDAGDAEHGASIHFVTAELDDGPVIAQTRLPVLSGDTPDSLAARLGPQEHRLLIEVMKLFSQGRVRMQGNRALLDGKSLEQPLRLEQGRLELA